MTQKTTHSRRENPTIASTPYTAIDAGVCNSSALVQNKSATLTVYVTDDGSDPSATSGMAIPPGTGYEWPNKSLPQSAVKVFSTGTDRVYSEWS